MGKFVETQETNFINNYVRSYLSASNDYSVFQEGSPTFCDYYSVDVRKSTVNIGLGNVVNVVGNESPIKFNKIENFAIYSASEMIPSLEFDEQSGLDTVMEGEALILPDTILPTSEDMFIISYQKEDQLTEAVYQVNNVEYSSYSNKTFYKISYSLVPYTREEIESRQVNEEYKLIYNNIGTGYKSVITVNDYILIEKMENKYQELSKFYIKYFFDKKLNSFIYDYIRTHSVMKDVDVFEERYKNIYDPKLAIFIKNNNLFIKQKTLLSNIYIDCLLSDREYDYEFTIYNLLENRNDIDNFKYDSVYLNLIKEKSIFTEFPTKYYENVHNITDFGNWHVTFNYKYFFTTNFKEYLYNYSNSDNIPDINIIEKLMILYIKEFDSLDKKEYMKIIKDIKVERNFHSYMLIPCVLFIINSIQEKILRKDTVE